MQRDKFGSEITCHHKPLSSWHIHNNCVEDNKIEEISEFPPLYVQRIQDGKLLDIPSMAIDYLDCDNVDKSLGVEFDVFCV